MDPEAQTVVRNEEACIDYSDGDQDDLDLNEPLMRDT